MKSQPYPPPLLVTAAPSKTPKKRKPFYEKQLRKKELDRVRGQSRVNIGAHFTRWRELRKQKGFTSDAELAGFLLDSHEGSSLLTLQKREDDFPKEFLGFHEEEERMTSMEIVVGIDDDDKDENLSTHPDSEMEQEHDRMSSSEDTGDVSDAEITENSFKDDSDDDYTPASSLRTSRVKVKKNAVAPTTKEEIVHEAANSEQGEQPPTINNIQVKREPKKKYICPNCGREFPRHCSLKRHLVIHTGKRPFKCFICGRGFTQGGNLKTHMKVHKGELHKWTLLQEKKQLTEAPVTANICGDCGMDFLEKQQLEEHRESHKKPYVCPDCGKTFKREKSVEIHQRIHSGESPFRCSKCGKTFTTAQSLKKHEAIHSGLKKFHCGQCGRSFLHYTYLKIHLNTHTGERPHLCSICGKGYSRAGTLKNHLRVHTGERPYTCEKCGKGFRFSQTYHAHLKIHDKRPKAPTRPLGRPKQQPLVGNDQKMQQPENM